MSQELCNTCPSRTACQTICPELELHLKEITKPQREKVIARPYYGRTPPWSSSIQMTRKEKEIVTLLGRGIPRADVCQILNIKRETLRNKLSVLKRKIVTV